MSRPCVISGPDRSNQEFGSFREIFEKESRHMNIYIKKKDFDAIVAYAKTNLPEEACGLIAGRTRGDERYIEKVYFLENTDHTNEHFTISPKAQIGAVKDMRAEGLSPLGNWHSHPETPSRPSAEDIRLAMDPKASYLILSLMNMDAPVLNGFSVKDGAAIKENLVIEE